MVPLKRAAYPNLILLMGCWEITLGGRKDELQMDDEFPVPSLLVRIREGTPPQGRVLYGLHLMTRNSPREARRRTTRFGGNGCFWCWAIALWLLTSIGATGCGSSRRIAKVEIANPFLGTVTIAVAPAVNVSGSTDFDVNRFADLMASELSHADRVAVIPVSRVLGALAVQGKDRVDSPAHAMEIAELVGADAILVFAVTEYDPYDPPSIGISAQLFGRDPWQGFDAGNDDDAKSDVHAEGGVARNRDGAGRVLAETQRIFNASHADVVGDIQSFARQRDADESPYGWRRYVVSQQHYIRYCCYATVRALLSGEHAAVVARGIASER